MNSANGKKHNQELENNLLAGKSAEEARERMLRKLDEKDVKKSENALTTNVREDIRRVFTPNPQKLVLFDKDTAEIIKDKSPLPPVAKPYFPKREVFRGRSLSEKQRLIAKTNYGKYGNSKRLITDLQNHLDGQGNYPLNFNVSERTLPASQDFNAVNFGMISYSGGFIEDRAKVDIDENSELYIDLVNPAVLEMVYVHSAGKNTDEVYETTSEVIEDLLAKKNVLNRDYLRDAAVRMENIDSDVSVGKVRIDRKALSLEALSLGNQSHRVLVIRGNQVLDATNLEKTRMIAKSYFKFSEGKISLQNGDIVLTLPSKLLSAFESDFEKSLPQEDEEPKSVDIEIEKINKLLELVEKSKSAGGNLDLNKLQIGLEKSNDLDHEVLYPNGSMSIALVQIK